MQSVAAKPSSINAFARKTVLRKFDSLTGGRINVNNGGNKESYGAPSDLQKATLIMIGDVTT